jgi:hypothetical protein
MPYIKPEERKRFKNLFGEAMLLLKDVPEDKVDGYLNYLITGLLILRYTQPESYYNYNRAMGLLESVKQEFYRRRVAPYEDGKIKENGDVY